MQTYVSIRTDVTEVEKPSVHQPSIRVKLNSLQFSRGIAAMLVVLHHGSSHVQIFANYLPMHGVFYFGHAGVDFFFVLSGFIIFFVHAKDLGCPNQLGHYVWQRFTRVYPAYWLIVALYVFVIYQPFPFSLLNFSMDLALLPMAKLETLGVAWTLQHELFFYTLFGLAILSKRLGILIFIAWLFLILLRYINLLPFLQPIWLNRVLVACNIEFTLGMFAAYYWLYHRMRFPRTILVISVCCFLGYGYLDNSGGFETYPDTIYLPYGVLSMLILICLVELECGHRFRFPRFWVVLGEASYSIYLSHLLFIGIAFKYLVAFEFMKQHPNMGYWCMIVFTMVGGVIISIGGFNSEVQS